MIAVPDPKRKRLSQVSVIGTLYEKKISAGERCGLPSDARSVEQYTTARATNERQRETTSRLDSPGGKSHSMVLP